MNLKEVVQSLQRWRAGVRAERFAPGTESLGRRTSEHSRGFPSPRPSVDPVSQALRAHYDWLKTDAGTAWFLEDCADRARRGLSPIATPSHLRDRADRIRRRRGRNPYAPV